jgi:ankyrin repeat protein
LSFFRSDFQIAVLCKAGFVLNNKVDAFDNRRRTALLYAARYGRTFAVSRLLDARANIGFADRAQGLVFLVQ